MRREKSNTVGKELRFSVTKCAFERKFEILRGKGRLSTKTRMSLMSYVKLPKLNGSIFRIDSARKLSAQKITLKKEHIASNRVRKKISYFI
jgi:hypothetical protein